MSGIIFSNVSVLGVEAPFIVVWLVVSGVFFRVRLCFVNILGFAQAIRVLSVRCKAPGGPGEISPFQAPTTAMSGTVGIGNIAGVAVSAVVGLDRGPIVRLACRERSPRRNLISYPFIRRTKRLTLADGRGPSGPVWLERSRGVSTGEAPWQAIERTLNQDPWP